MAEHDDREQPDWPRYERRVTHDELRGELTEFREAMERGFARLTLEIKSSEDKWSERTHAIANDLHVQEIAAAVALQRIEAIERLAKEQVEARRWLWGQVIAAATIVAMVVTWAIDKVKHP